MTLIKREDAIEAVHDACNYCDTCDLKDIGCSQIQALSALPSAEAVPQSEQYKKGFEDAKRAFELEYAREAESIRKRNAQLEVMLNVQKAISAEAEWIPCSERLPAMGDYVLTYRPSLAMRMVVDSYEGYYGEDDDEWYEEWVYGGDKVVAWMPLPMPYRKGGKAE